jgi:hypothetical protein
MDSEPKGFKPPCPICHGQPTRETPRYDGTPLYLDKCGSWYEGEPVKVVIKDERKRKPRKDGVK